MSHEPDPVPVRDLETAGGRLLVFDSPEAASLAAARRVRRAVADRDGRAVLGLATGGTPIRLYRRLVQDHRDGLLSFRDVVTFNLDEYYPISPLDPRSYRFYMHEHLFARVDLPPNHAHLLDGTVPAAAVADHAAQFDRWIRDAGGIDLQLLGIGRNGHIGFNEPSDLPIDQALALPTRLAELDPVTIEDAARDFDGNPDRVPRRALTMGVAPILAARAILVLAFGPAKAQPLARALRGPITPRLPASLLQTVRDRVAWIVDPPAASQLP